MFCIPLKSGISRMVWACFISSSIIISSVSCYPVHEGSEQDVAHDTVIHSYETSEPVAPEPPVNEDKPRENSENQSPEHETNSDSSEIYESISQDQLLEECGKAASCNISNKVWYVCGDDGRTYLNLGVFVCAQVCKKELKLRYFRPCDGNHPIKRTTKAPKPWRTTTEETIIKTNLTAILLKNDTEESADPNMVQLIQRRILARQELNPVSDDVKQWCRRNPTQCYLGYDPEYNPMLYIIPVKRYTETQKWMKDQWNISQAQFRRITNQVFSSTRKPLRYTWI